MTFGVKRPTRLKFADPETGCYHIVSRAIQREFRFNLAERRKFLSLLRWLSQVYFVRVGTFALMNNHIHLVIKMIRSSDISEAELRRRFDLYYNQGVSEEQKKYLRDEHVDKYYQQFSDISNFMWDLKLRFSRWYNEEHDGCGHVWSERFKSIMLVGQKALRACMLYVDLNAVRARMVKEPEKYAYCGLAQLVAAGRRSSWLDYGLLEDAVTCFDFDDAQSGASKQDMVRRYLEIVYREGLNLKHGKGSIPVEVLQSKNFEWSEEVQKSVYMKPIPHFTHGTFIGEREDCNKMFSRFRSHFTTKKERTGTHIFQKPKKGIKSKIPSYLNELCAMWTYSIPQPQ